VHFKKAHENLSSLRQMILRNARGDEEEAKEVLQKVKQEGGGMLDSFRKHFIGKFSIN